MTVQYEGHARHFGYYDDYAAMEFLCGCGWRGLFSEMAKEHHEDLFDASCPRCDTTLAIVSLPAGNEVREAAQRGNKKAGIDLEGVRKREVFLDRYASMALKEALQLPELDGSSLRFVWAPEEVGGERQVAIRLASDGREVWREAEAWENWHHFLEVRRILRERYGARFRGLDVHEDAWGYLLGDNTFASRRIDQALAEDAALRDEAGHEV